MDIFSPTVLILVGFVIVLLGIGAGMLLSTLNEESEPEAENIDQSPPGGRKGRYTAVARIWRERESRVLIIEMDGKSFLSPETLDDEQRKSLENSARDLRAWLGMGLAPVTNDAIRLGSTEDAAVIAEGANHQASNHADTAPDVFEEGARIYPASAAVEPAAVAPAVAAALVAAGVPKASKSIVMQIEDILQDMIAGTLYEKRGLHLLEDPTRGVIVKLGLKEYEGVDSVPEPEVKGILKKAVQVWESNQ